MLLLPNKCCKQFLSKEFEQISVGDAPSSRALPAAADENKSSWTESCCSRGKGGGNSLTGERPGPFSQTAFIGNGMCRCTQHTCIAHQSMSEGCSHIKTGIIYR